MKVVIRKYITLLELLQSEVFDDEATIITNYKDALIPDLLWNPMETEIASEGLKHFVKVLVRPASVQIHPDVPNGRNIVHVFVDIRNEEQYQNLRELAFALAGHCSDKNFHEWFEEDD